MLQRFRPWLTDPALWMAWQKQLSEATSTSWLWREVLQLGPDLFSRFTAHYRWLRSLPRQLRRALQRQGKHSLAGVVLLLSLQPTSSWAANFTAATAKELIAAIKLANATPAPDTITLTANIILTLPASTGGAGLPAVLTPITIVGNGHSIARSRRALPFSIMVIGPTGNLTLQETKVSGGWTPSNGGGIFNSHGVVTLTNSTVTGSSAHYGGGIFNDQGAITLMNSTVLGNSATKKGGGVYNASGVLTLTDSAVSENSATGHGGGVFNDGGALTLTHSTVSSNSAISGGGVSNDHGTATLMNSIVSGNTASASRGATRDEYNYSFGGGIFNDSGILTLTNSTVSGNTSGNTAYDFGYGGGMFNDRGTVTLTNTRVSANVADDSGGIDNKAGVLTLTHSVVSGNTSGGITNRYGVATLTNSTVSGNSGGGIFNGGLYPDYGTLTLTNSTVSGNVGGGVFTSNGLMTLTHSTIFHNSAGSGGGMFIDSGAVMLTHSTISHNFAGSDGGGVSNNIGMVTLIHSTVSGNSAGVRGGGAFNWSDSGVLSLTDSTVSGNSTAGDGGGVANLYGRVLLSHSTVSGNSAGGGGGVTNLTGPGYGFGTEMLTNCTVSGNSTSGNGGGVSNDGVLTLTSSTVSGNSARYGGGGVFSPGIVELSQSLISGNTASSAMEFATANTGNYFAELTLFGHNGLTTAQAFDYFTPDATDIIATSDGTKPTALTAILNPTLADNGGSTETHNLVSGSPAIDAAPDDANCPVTDQRGALRPFGPKCDIGAVEFGATPPFAFSGFLPPLGASGSFNIVKSGQSVLLQFSLDGDQGLDILAEEEPTSRAIICKDTAPTVNLNASMMPARGNSLRYDAKTDTYTYIWQTARTWANTCRQLVVKLRDGTKHRANFWFRK